RQPAQQRLKLFDQGAEVADLQQALLPGARAELRDHLLDGRAGGFFGAMRRRWLPRDPQNTQKTPQHARLRVHDRLALHARLGFAQKLAVDIGIDIDAIPRINPGDLPEVPRARRGVLLQLFPPRPGHLIFDAEALADGPERGGWKTAFEEGDDFV